MSQQECHVHLHDWQHDLPQVLVRRVLVDGTDGLDEVVYILRVQSSLQTLCGLVAKGLYVVLVGGCVDVDSEWCNWYTSAKTVVVGEVIEVLDENSKDVWILVEFESGKLRVGGTLLCNRQSCSPDQRARFQSTVGLSSVA